MDKLEMVESSRDVITATPLEIHACGRCATFYQEFKQLLAHLYWRHGTESQRCSRCGLRRWRYAEHRCHVLPIEDLLVVEECEDATCVCGEQSEDLPMIGCDGPSCRVQWYHFPCAGVVHPPDGDWYCFECRGDNKNT